MVWDAFTFKILAPLAFLCGACASPSIQGASATEAALLADPKRIWMPVPGHPGVYVDWASRHALPYIPADPNHVAGWPDTSVDAMVHGELLRDMGFYCSNPTITSSDLHVGYADENGSNEHMVEFPFADVRAVVCGQ